MATSFARLAKNAELCPVAGNVEEFARHRRFGSNVSSLGSDAEFDAVTIPQQQSSSTPPQHQYESSPEHTPPPKDAPASPHNAHLPPRPHRASSGPLPRGITDSGVHAAAGPWHAPRLLSQSAATCSIVFLELQSSASCCLHTAPAICMADPSLGQRLWQCMLAAPFMLDLSATVPG